MEKTKNSIACKLCSEVLCDDQLLSHLKNCVSEHIEDEFILRNSNELQKYYIFLYILGYIDEWNTKIPMYKKSNYSMAFQIYQHFHHLKTETLWKSALIGCDDVCRQILSEVEFPEDYYLQIPPVFKIHSFQK